MPGLSIAREAAVLVSFISLFWLYGQSRKHEKRIAPKELGRLLAWAFAVLAAVVLLSTISGITTRPAENGARESSAIVILVGTVSSISLVALASFVLLIVRELVLFKRRQGTKRSLLIYELLLASTSLSAILTLPFQQAFVGSILFTLTVLFAVVISFRQNWIVYLSRREKIYALVYSGLLFALFVLLNVVLAENTLGNKALTAFSRPLQSYVQLNAVLGAIYFGMAFVSTLFHLPTAEVYERKQSELNSLHNLSRLITQVFDFNDLVNMVTQMTMEVCGARSAWLEIIDTNEATGEMNIQVVSRKNINQEDVAAFSDAESNSMRHMLLESKAVMMVDDVWNDRRTRFLKDRGKLKGSLLSVPLVSHDKLMGVLYASKQIEYGFDQDDVEVLTTFADNVTIAIENSRLIVRSIERERLQQEMLVAQRMQQRLLPQTVPQHPSLDIAATSVSSLEVGGDYYDFVSLPNEQLGIVVGDVSGKGVSAAFYMAEVKGVFLSLSKICTTSKQLLDLANQSLMESLERKAFISLIYGVLDLKTGSLNVSRAGHCPLVFVSEDKQELIRPNGLGLGLTNRQVFSQTTEERIILLKKNDVCVFYTDGVTESQNGSQEEFGYSRLLEATRQARMDTANEIKNRILNSIHEFTGTSSYGDDMTLVVIKWLGA
ncbi:MAG: SpoIIE family protein phosphatase [Ignavibacteriales bacterium]|nr:SpoIIE family protein phosphatase [Ignavibacteriales bacterium]